MEPAHSLRGPGGTPQLDFSGYYASSTLADCTITITTVETDEEPSAPAAKRAKAVAGGNAAAVDVLPGHAIVLSTSSSWMRRQIEASAASAGGPAAHAPDVTLRVRPGQEPAARRLVRFIYEGAASMPSAGAAAAGGASGQATQALLVDMLALSHTYRVPTCGSVCLSRLLAVPLPQLAWSTVSQVLRLPAAQLSAAEVRPLVAACLDRLQGDFGDLEAVAGQAATLQRFCALPFQAVLQLLLDERTAAASENTALAAVHAWLAAQPPGAAGPDERRALAGAVRVPQLEPLMLVTVVPRMGWLAEVLGVEGLALAAGAARGQYDVAAEPVLSTQVPAMPPAWLRGPRPVPASAAGPDGPQLSFEWSVPVHQLRQLFEDTATFPGGGGGGGAAAALAAAAAAELPEAGPAGAAAGDDEAGAGGEHAGSGGGGGGLSGLLGAGLFGWRRVSGAGSGGGGGGGGSVTSTATKRLHGDAAAPAAAPAGAAPPPAPPGGRGGARSNPPRLRSPAAVFAGHRFNMVMYFQLEREQDRDKEREEGPQHDGQAGLASGSCDEPPVLPAAAAAAPRGAASGGGGAAVAAAGAGAPHARAGRRGRSRAASDDATPARDGAKPRAAARAGGGGGGSGAAAGDPAAGAPRWTVRLAVEAAPCVPLRGPSSVVAFCGRLSALRLDGGGATPAASGAGDDGAVAARGGGSGGGGSSGADQVIEDSDDDESPGVWEARELPQGSWVRSRACDTGFRNFFGARVARGKWDVRAFRPFLVGPEGGALRLRCELYNVR